MLKDIVRSVSEAIEEAIKGVDNIATALRTAAKNQVVGLAILV